MRVDEVRGVRIMTMNYTPGRMERDEMQNYCLHSPRYPSICLLKAACPVQQPTGCKRHVETHSVVTELDDIGEMLCRTN
jgi:hypothetical protein